MKICKNCGKEIADGDRFCIFCGMSQMEPSADMGGTPIGMGQPGTGTGRPLSDMEQMGIGTGDSLAGMRQMPSSMGDILATGGTVSGEQQESQKRCRQYGQELQETHIGKEIEN